MTITITTPVQLIQNDRISIFQTDDYADRVPYSDMERPSYGFTAEAWEKNNMVSTCTFDAAMGDRSQHMSIIDDIRTCFTENFDCTNTFSKWVYWGGANDDEYGLRLSSVWNWYGTRRESSTDSTSYLDVRTVSTNSDDFPPMIDYNTSPPYEMDQVTVETGGVLRFHIGANG